MFKFLKKKDQKGDEGKPPSFLYDALMEQIEPELTTERIAKLDEMYVGETEEEKKERGEYYKECFGLFSEMWEEFIQECEEMIKNYKDSAHTLVHEHATEQDAQTMKNIEDELDQS
jgi:hypothetical protein